MIFTTANHYGYFRQVYWHNLIFTTLFLIHIMKKHDKYYEWVVILCLCVSVCCGHLNYLVQTVKPIHAQYVDEKQNGLSSNIWKPMISPMDLPVFGTPIITAYYPMEKSNFPLILAFLIILICG